MSPLQPSTVLSAAAPGRSIPPWGRAALLAWTLLCIALLFCGAMTRSLTYDEDQYIAAGVMTRVLMPYRDFAYLQAPLYPFVLAAFFEFAQGWFLLMARLVSFGLAVLSGALLWHLVRRLGAGLLLSVVLLTACLSSPFLLAPLANARNDGLPLMLMLAGLAAHFWADGQKDPWLERTGRCGAAVLLGLAVEAKVSYLFGPVAIGIHALGMPGRRLPPVLLGLAVAALPAALCWLVAPEGFWFGLAGYHLAAPGYWYRGADLAALLEPWSRLQALGEYAALGGNLALVLLSAALSMVATARRRTWKRPGAMLLGMTLGALGLALLPAPSWAMYFAAVAPLLACCVAHLERITTHLAGAQRKQILVGLAGVSMLPFLALQLAELPKLLDKQQWVGFAVHRDAQAIRALVPRREGEGEVATLFPMLVIDANPVRLEFATGPFVFRSGEAFPQDQLTRLHALSPSMLEAALNDDPPSAIYAGRYPDAWTTPMDSPLLAYAERHGWRLVRKDALGGQLFVPP